MTRCFLVLGLSLLSFGIQCSDKKAMLGQRVCGALCEASSNERLLEACFVFFSEEKDDAQKKIALEKAAYEQTKAALDRGADVNAATLPFACTALHRAAQAGYVSVATLLIERGACVNARNSYGYEPRHTALLSCGEESKIYTLLDGYLHEINN